jgi:tetratricopeptide (TPR) repeat protein
MSCTLAWIGHAANLADPLGRIVAGTFDPRADAMRLRIEQGVALRERRLLVREAAGSAEYKRVNNLVIAGKLAEALAATDHALTQFAGCPNATGLLRRMKMYLLANLPGRTEEAVVLATDLAIDARLSGRWIDVANTASGLLNAADRAAAVDRDQRLVDLAIALLTGPDPDDLRGKPPGEVQQRRASSLARLGWAYHLRGDHPKAVAAVQDALAITEKLKPDPGADEKEFAVEQKQAADFFRERLAEFRRAAGRGAK